MHFFERTATFKHIKASFWRDQFDKDIFSIGTEHPVIF